jgi:DNA-binding beta-propeller fold protein YncE
LAAACGGAGPVPEEPSAQDGNTKKATAGIGKCERRDKGVGAVRIDERRVGGAVALGRLGERTIAYVADEDDDAIHTIDVDSGATYATTPVSGAPSQVMILEDGRVAATIRDKNRVQILEPQAAVDKPLTSLCSIKTPVEPVALAATPDDKSVIVSSGFARKITSYDASSFKVKTSYDVPREPRTIVVDDDGRRVFVAHVVGGKLSVIDLEGSPKDVRNIELRVPKVGGRFGKGQAAFSGNSGEQPMRNDCQGFALAKSVSVEADTKPAVAATPAGPEQEAKELKTKPLQVPSVPKGRIFAPRVTVDPGEPLQRSSGYGNNSFARIEAPMVSVIDTAAERSLTTALLGAQRGGAAPRGECLLPRAAAVSAATGGLLVSCLGTDAVVELDPRGTDPARLELRRWRVPSGPTGLAVDDAKARAVVWSQFDRQLTVIDLANERPSFAVRTVSAPEPRNSKMSLAAYWGRRLFHQTDDQRISNDGRACASCHPDGREDSLTWSTPVGPRQTMMLAGRLKGTGPFSWLGQHESVEVHVKSTFERLGGSGLPHRASGDSELSALLAYLHEMPAPNQSDALRDAKSERLFARGKELFYNDATGCANCHTAGRTDHTAHDIGTRTAGDNDSAFDTPSLRFVAATAPYFHDGRYPTMMELLMATDSQMGHTMHLSHDDALALDAYLETL